MQNRSGYCSFCCVFYNNLEQHISSDHHRSLITQKRQRMGAASLMERFLQDVLRHHPWHHPCDYQESRSVQNERLHMTTVSPSEVVPNNDFSPEIKTEDAAGVREEISTKASEPVEKFYSRPQGYIHSVSDRPSVIQKLEKGQQHPLEFIHKVGSSMKEFNPVGLGHSTNNRQSVICSSAISNALVSCLPESSHERPVTADTTTGLSLGVPLDSVNKCDPNKVDKYLKQLDKGSRNPMLPSHPETSSVPYQKPEELNRKSLRINSDKLTLQENVNSQTKALSTGFKVHEFAGTENSLKLASLSKFAVSPVVNLNKTDMPSNKGIFEDDILKHHEKFFPNMDHNQEGKHLVFNKSAFLEEKISVSSEMKSAGGSLQSASDYCEEAEPALWKGEQTDQEDKNCESRDSEVGFDGSSSFYSLMDQSKGTAEEINLSKEVHTDLQYKNNTSYISEISSDCDDSLQLTTSRTQVKDGSVQKARHIRLVDESYESSDSEMNFDCDASLQSTDDSPQQPEKEVNLPMGAFVGLVDMSYGSSSSEISADSVFSLQSMPGQLPVTVTETELRKEVHMSLVDKNYGSSCSETSFDGNVSLQSVFDHPHVAVSERNLEDRLVSLKDRNYKPSSAKAYLDCDVSLETRSDGPQKDVENINLQKEKNGLVDVNCEFHGPEIKFHLRQTDPQLVPAQSQVAVKEVNAQEVVIDLENKSVKSGISDLSFESHPIGASGEINMKALNVDMEVKSYGCSSFESTFDSDSSFMSVSEYPELDVEEISKHVNLEHESFESISSEITFYSDSPLHSVIDQSQVTVYEEDPIDLENKSCESYVSEITFDSDVPLYSGTYQPEVVVKETFIQKEACTHLGEKDDVPTGSEISLASYIPFHSVINQPEEAVKNLNLEKEEWVHLENKENESSDSEIFDYDIFRSMTGHSEEPIKEGNLQKRENMHLENKDNVPIVSESSLKSGITFHLVTGHLSIAIKEINQKEEHVNLTDKNNESKVSETSLDIDIPLQSVTHKPELIVKELGLQKEKHAKLKGQSAEYSDSEISLDSDYSMTEPQITVKEISVQKEERVGLENKSDKCSSSEIILDSGVPLQSMNEKPQTTVLKEDHVDPEEESTGPRGFEKKLNTSNSLHSVIDQPQLALLKEKHVHLEDTNNESSDGKVDFDSADPLQPLTEQFQEVVEETNVQKEEVMSLKNKVDEPNEYKLIHNSDVSLPSVSSQPKVAVKRINLKNENHVYLKDKNRQDSGYFAMSLNSDLMDQSVVDHPQITILEQKHTELEDKHNQSCGSEVSFNSVDPLQSVANRLRQTVKEINSWRDEVDVEDKRDEPKHFEIVSDSDACFQSVASQTEVVKKVNLLKERVDLEDKVVKPSDSKINLVSDEPLQSVANEVQEAVTEMNLLRDGPVCLSAKSYEPNDSEIIFVSNTPLQSVVEPHHNLEEQQANLEDKSNDPCGPKINFVSECPLQSVTGQHQKKAVKEIGLWEEDHIYLEDKRYKLGDFEVSYDSNVDFVAGHSTVAVKEINLQEEDQNDLENKNCELSVSEIKCDSGVHLQLGVDQPQVVCKEINLQMEKHLDMQEEVSEPRDSEIMCDSDVPLQIVINELEESDRETDKMLFVDLTASDDDCEMMSDSDVPFQPAIDSPQRTVKEISCINAESFDLDENCDSCDSELRYVCEASPQSVTNHSKKVFKVVKQKQDYIILEETSCEPYVSELSFQIDSSHQSVTYQSQESEKKKAKYSDSKDKSCQSSDPKRNFEWEETSQPVTQQQQKVDKGVNLWKDVENIGLKDKNCESGVSTMDFNASPGLVIHQMPDQENLLKLKHTDLESMICEPCGSGVNFQCDPSLQSGNDRPQEAVNKINLFKKMSFDQRETNHNNSHSDSVPMVDSIRDLEKAKEVIEDDLHELLPKDLSPVPPSFVGKMWSQIMKEDDVQMSALVKEFKKGHLYCYFVSDCEMRKIKKKILNEEKKMTWTDLNQDTTSFQVLSDCDDNVGGISDIDDFSVALDKPNHYPSTERNHEQTWQEASQGQAIKVSHGTQTNLTSHPGTKRRISGQEKDSPVRKHLLLQNDGKSREKVKKNEFPESGISVLKPLQANTLIYILSSNIKLKKGESNSFSKRKDGSRNNWNINIQYKFNQSSFNCYDPLNKQIVIDPSLNIEVPGSDRNNCVEMHVSHLNSNAGDNDPYVQSSASVPFVAVSAGHELKTQEASESSVFPEKSRIFSSSEISKECNFQSTFSSRDVAKTSSKSFRKRFLKSKSKNQRRKVVANNKPDFPKKGCRSVIPQQNTRSASEKRSIWIQSKLSDIIKKYIPKYSVFLRHKYQCRSTSVRMHVKKKKPDVSRLKKVKKPANVLSNSSVLSAGAEEQSRAIASSSPKQPVQTSSSAAQSKKNGNKKHPRRQQRKPYRPIRTYDLRSLFSGISYSDRMRTRFSNKL